MLKNIILFSAACASSALAQETPSKYCASLGGGSCEVLNVVAISSNVTPLGPAFLIKQCKNGRFETRIVHLMQGKVLAVYQEVYISAYPAWATAHSGSTMYSGLSVFDPVVSCW